MSPLHGLSPDHSFAPKVCLSVVQSAESESCELYLHGTGPGTDDVSASKFVPLTPLSNGILPWSACDNNEAVPRPMLMYDEDYILCWVLDSHRNTKNGIV